MGGVARVLRRILQLQDVNAASIADGETLVWDAAAEEFIPGAGGGGGGVPSGPAGGVLGGTYPNPGFAADMATQAELDAEASTRASADSVLAGAITAHEADTTAVHGIADTSSLYVAGGTDVAVADGGTGASTAAGARTNLGLGALATLAAVGSAEITNDSIVNADVNSAAAIAYSKLEAVSGLADSGRGRFDDLAVVERAGVRQKISVEDLFGYVGLGPARRRFVCFDDFFGVMASSGYFFTLGSTGSGAGVSSVGTDAVNRVGIVRVSTGTTSSGSGRILGGSAATICLGAGVAVFECAINVAALSTSSERFQFFIGFLDSFTTVQTDGVGFVYDEGGVLGGSAASANWQTLSASNGVRTYTTTSVAVAAATWVTLRIEVNAAGTLADFYINGVLTATSHTTNIPTGVARATGLGCGLVKNVGTTARTVDVDYIGCEIDFTTARA